jgi:hypothetical protein
MLSSVSRAGEPIGPTLEYRAYCVADVLIERPIGLVMTVSGFGLFIVTLPFSALGGNAQEVGNKLVERPFKYTFKRPLGHFQEE